MAASNYLEKCERCGLNCELAQEYNLLIQNDSEENIPYYKTRDLANCCVEQYFHPKSCNAKYISDGIGDDYKVDVRYNSHLNKVEFITDNVMKWKSERFVFISAQTGRGKNHFVENEILKYVRNLNFRKRTNFKVLIVSNRIALRLQIENRLKGTGNYDDEDDKIYPYEGCADVISYQGLLKQIGHLRWKQLESETDEKYIFVVCDEAHFFTSDSMFNPHTGRILHEIVDIFKNSIRIYMTATPYECLRFITEYEIGRLSFHTFPNIELFTNPPKDNIPKNYSSNRRLFYHFPRDYNYLDIKYFSNYDELIDIILNSGKEKWLVFNDNINACNNFKADLEAADEGDKDAAKKNKYFTVDARSKTDENYQKIILDENLGNTKVLISTSVVDNGVNFRGIKNIVVSDISRVKCMQMLGRARVSEDDNGNPERITLYIKRLNEKLIEKSIASLETLKEAYHEHDLACKTLPNGRPDNGQIYKFNEKYYGEKATANICKNFRNAVHWFGRYEGEPNKLYQNGIARLMAESTIPVYESIRDEMIKTDTEDGLPGQNYLEYQLSWFKKEYNGEPGMGADIFLAAKTEATNELVEFLEPYADGEIKFFTDDKDNGTDKFREVFTKLHDEAFGRADKNVDRAYARDKINKLLEQRQLSYKLESDRETAGKKRTYWKVVRFDRNITGIT